MKTLSYARLSLLAASAGFASAATASFTPVLGPPAGEMSVIDILNGVYGAGFTNDFENPGTNSLGVTATRVADFGGTGNLPLVGPPGSADDARWADGTAKLKAEAKFAGLNQQFGWIDGGDAATNANFQKLFDVTGSGFAVSGSATGEFTSDFVWARRTNDAGDRLWTSDPNDNGDSGGPGSVGTPDGTPDDHMITFWITGTGINQPTWLVFWEDLAFDDGAFSGVDFDYNDLVVEIKWIPLPGPGLLGAAGLLGLAATRRRM